jgi:hypothetical protein
MLGHYAKFWIGGTADLWHASPRCPSSRLKASLEASETWSRGIALRRWEWVWKWSSVAKRSSFHIRLLTFIRLPPCSRLINWSAKQDQNLLNHGRGRKQIAPAVSTEMPAQCRARVSSLVIVSLRSPRSECELLCLSYISACFLRAHGLRKRVLRTRTCCNSPCEFHWISVFLS